MNKQELLYELNRLLPKQGTESSFLSGGRAGIELAITLVEELEEPEKVVIPQFVAEWIEEEQDAMSNWKLPSRFISDSKYKKDQRRYKWSQVGGNMDKFMSALINGYEVEKEKLYYVKMPNTEEYLTLKEEELYFTEKMVWMGEKPKDITQLFTKDQLKKYNEIYWKNAQESKDYD